MPSEQSLEKQQYYGNKRNQFWNIMYQLFYKDIEDDYRCKKKFVLKQHIAVWDVLKSCHREGSSDAKILNPVPNDFEKLFTNYPKLQAVFFNGGTAEKLFNRLVKPQLAENYNIRYYQLPSTSPAYTKPFKNKLEKWKMIIHYLDNSQIDLKVGKSL